MKSSYQQQSNIYKGGLRGVGLSSWARNKRWLSKCEGCWNKFGKMVVLWSFVKNVPSGTFQCLFLVTSVRKKIPFFKFRFCQFGFQLSDNHKKIPKTSEPVESTGYRPFSFTTIVIGNALTAGFSFFSFPSFRFHLLLFFPPLSQFLFILLLFLLLYISPHLVTLGKSSPQMDPTCQVHLV